MAGKNLFCYVVRAESSSDEEVPYLFVRKQNPVQLIGKKLFRFHQGALVKLEDSVFRLDDSFDVVIHGENIAALHMDRFERLFSDSQVVLAKVEQWVTTAFTTIRLSEAANGLLVQSGKTNRYYRKKLQSLARKPYMQTLTVDALVERAQRHSELDCSTWSINGDLNVTRSNQKILIGYLNEDIYRGEFSNELHQSSSKSPLDGDS